MEADVGRKPIEIHKHAGGDDFPCSPTCAECDGDYEREPQRRKDGAHKKRGGERKTDATNVE